MCPPSARLIPAKKNVYSPSAPKAGGKIWQEECTEHDPEVNFEASIDPMFFQARSEVDEIFNEVTYSNCRR